MGGDIQMIRIIITLIFLTQVVQAQVTLPFVSGSTPGSLVIPAYADVTPNWQNAGLAVIGGIPAGRTQCGSTINPSGITPPAGSDDASVINAAIQACTSGHFVQLGSGTFQLDMTEQVSLTKAGITLRGTGNCTNASSPYCSTVIQYYNGAWPTYNPSAYCGNSTGTPPSGTPPGSFVACPNGGNALVVVGPNFSASFLGWGATSGKNCQVGNANPTTVPCGTLLTADASKGDTTVSVASTANFAAGDWVYIEDNPLYTTQTNPLFAQYIAAITPSTTVSATPDEFNTTLTPVTPRTENVDNNCSYSMCTARLNGEIKLITSVGSGTITFDSPLTMDKRNSNSHDARLYWLTGCGCGSGPTPPTKVAFLAQTGIENVTLSRAGTGSGPLAFQFCAYCWAQNVETSYWIGGVTVAYSARVQVGFSYLHDCVDCQNNGNEYPYSSQSGSSEILLQDSIVVLGGKGMVGRASNSTVISYNYVDKTFYQQSGIGDWFLDMALNGSHEGGTHHWLMEGNWSPSCDGDQTHGAAAYHSFYRNACNGLRTPFNDPSNTSLHVNDSTNTCFCGAGACGAGVPTNCGRLRAAGPMSYNYGYTFAGNVLGQAGVTTSANGWIYSARTAGHRGTGSSHPMTDKALWQSGWTGQDPANCCNYVSDPNLDGTNATQLLFQNCNYDYINASIVDCAGSIYTSSLPNSLYLPGGGASPPPWWPSGSTTYPFPWVTPSAGSPLQTNSLSGSGLPAKARFDAGTPFVQP